MEVEEEVKRAEKKSQSKFTIIDAWGRRQHLL